MSSRLDANRAVIEEFRANGGTVSSQIPGIPLLLLTTTGAKSGERRTMPLGYGTDNGRLIVIAANGGRPTHPGWYYNLVAQPTVTVEVGDETFAAHAVVAQGEERERLYARLVSQSPVFASFAQKTERQLPIIILDRIR